MAMEIFILILLSLFTLVKTSTSETIVVDGLGEWKHPSVLVGDIIIFKHIQHYNLYIFHNRREFKQCNSTQAILLTDPNSNSFTWHPSRPGFFYFVFINASQKTCQETGKLPILVSLIEAPINKAPSPSPQISPSPYSKAWQWHLLLPPEPSPAPMITTNIPPVSADKGNDVPFINSNPAIPLPTEADAAATLHPLPISGAGGNALLYLGQQIVGLLALQMLGLLFNS